MHLTEQDLVEVIGPFDQFHRDFNADVLELVLSDKRGGGEHREDVAVGDMERQPLTIFLAYAIAILIDPTGFLQECHGGFRIVGIGLNIGVVSGRVVGVHRADQARAALLAAHGRQDVEFVVAHGNRLAQIDISEIRMRRLVLKIPIVVIGRRRLGRISPIQAHKFDRHLREDLPLQIAGIGDLLEDIAV